jgi:cell division protein FtsA
VIPIAGDQVTNDIAVSMRTPTQYAEEIKIRYACALSQLANPDETIEVPSVGDRPPRRLARQTLAEVVEPRYEELFGLIRDELRRSGFEEMIAAGVVLTGGSAKMEGAIELAEEVFHMPVRLGRAAACARARRRRAQPDLFDRRGAAALYPWNSMHPAPAGRVPAFNGRPQGMSGTA